jgi:hypothetical protein
MAGLDKTELRDDPRFLTARLREEYKDAWLGATQGENGVAGLSTRSSKFPRQKVDLLGLRGPPVMSESGGCASPDAEGLII